LHINQYLIFSCTPEDVDGNKYKTVLIGGQTWTSENLKVTHYRNGDPIPNITDSATWVNLTTGAYCDYNNDPANSNTYGRLYNWYAVNDSRGIAPLGWHVPTNLELATLINYLGGSGGAGCKLKVSYTNTPPWDGTNLSGFTALPAGLRFNGKCALLGTSSSFWSSTGYNATEGVILGLTSMTCGSFNSSYDKSVGISIRCIRD
jgi:uncharacterized protein (TIGR02145 family)